MPRRPPAIPNRWPRTSSCAPSARRDRLIPFDPARQCDEVFEHRLDGEGPLGVAVSGGGDSVALLMALARWNRRPLEVFCVDHGLNPESAVWTERVRRLAEQAGAGFSALSWDGDKPKAGLSAAARLARHRLLAEAARSKGVRVMCLGHTRDDIAEAEAMRAAGSNVGAPQTWSPSPVWPQGDGIFLFRPLLGVRRAALRVWLEAQDTAWIDDPANVSPQSLRARVRQEVAASLPAHVESEPLMTRVQSDDLIDAQYSGHGLIIFRRSALADGDMASRLPKCLALAAVCAGGGDKLPRSQDMARLVEGLGPARTLCGARIEADRDHILIARDAGDMARRPRGSEIWDGRFEILEAGAIVASKDVRPRSDDVRELPQIVRDSVPMTTDANVALRQSSYRLARATCRVLPRFLAAAGVLTRESEIA